MGLSTSSTLDVVMQETINRELWFEGFAVEARDIGNIVEIILDSSNVGD